MHLFAIADKFEIHAIGIDQIGKGFLVSFALFNRIAFERDDILVDILRFAPADRHIPALKQEIGHPGIGLFGFVDDIQIGINRLKQSLQRAAIAMFGCLPTFIFGAHLIEIVADIHPSNRP
ncbi:hypothetical protein [Parasphingorhabdus sp.]|uniref:hypothetical protein n=1 Tax=Parasphingorhabdus sp. TaxID=2709688 RepID=UPI003D2E43FA